MEESLIGHFLICAYLGDEGVTWKRQSAAMRGKRGKRGEGGEGQFKLVFDRQMYYI